MFLSQNIKKFICVFFILKNSVEHNYRERIAELRDQNERKDLRIKLLEQKIQKLQVFIILSFFLIIKIKIFISFRKHYLVVIEYGLKTNKICVYRRTNSTNFYSINLFTQGSIRLIVNRILLYFYIYSIKLKNNSNNLFW